MAQAPDQIRADIELTRADLARDIDQLADRTMPNRMVKRRWNAMRAKMRRANEKVMGEPSGPDAMTGTSQAPSGGAHPGKGSHVAEMRTKATESVQHAPEMMRRRTEGNPMAAGLIAFGAGLLVASLLPESDQERRAGKQMRHQAEGITEQMREPLTEAAHQMRDDMSGSARQAADRVKATAMSAGQTTSEEAKSSARRAAEQTRQTRQTS